jgi:hypothetical protein
MVSGFHRHYGSSLRLYLEKEGPGMEMKNQENTCIGPEQELDKPEGLGIEQLKANSQMVIPHPTEWLDQN